MKKTVLALAVLAAATILLGGCFRKHIESAPPVRQPAERTEAAPAPGVIEETHVVGDEKPLDAPVEEVYEVDAAKQAGTKAPSVGETDLAEEPLPDADQLKREAEAAAAEGASPAVAPSSSVAGPAAKPVAQPTVQPAPAAAAPAKVFVNPEDEVVEPETSVTPAPLAGTGGAYYVQVGAFSDLENANRALSRLLSDGYKGSVLIKTDEGLYRVQAGSFPDEASAGVALDRLKADYPKGFVLKRP